MNKKGMCKFFDFFTQLKQLLLIKGKLPPKKTLLLKHFTAGQETMTRKGPLD